MKLSLLPSGDDYSDLEFSTQLLIKEALSRKINVEVLDRHYNIIRLSNHSKIEYIQQATRTSVDSHITSRLLDNKYMTKMRLAEQGIPVPKGSIYYSFEDLQVAFEYYHNHHSVVKPNSLSSGRKISFLSPDSPFEEWQKAFEIVFQNDTAIVVETFVGGNDFRFLVIDYRCVAVVQRVPANVVGDGKHTLKKLVEIKNRDFRRGQLNNTPLCPLIPDRIGLKEIARQRLTFESIPAPEQTVYLRQTANISTGGDSIDFTDQVHESYKTIAEISAKTLGARITGVDLLIENPSRPRSDYNCFIVELNANPALAIHSHPYQGKGRPVGSDVLNLLGF
ncbi:hypothetical protein QUF76_03525 [Desulfobacterales bacterium HSG16]|nr:hypothetical protein [Desulfobacterales bacterium HSG16]